MKTFDYIIVGTGQATGTLVGKLLTTGKSIAIIEGNKIGGSCVNYGCTPTKTMVAAVKAIHMAKSGAFYGFSAGDVKTDFSRVRERMNEIRNGNRDAFTKWLESREQITLFYEWAYFTGEKTIKVGSQEIKGETIFINTGTHPFIPPIEGISQVNALDSAGLLDLDTLPEHLLILGGGYIGVEFAQIFNRLGSKVTVVQGAGQLMPREDKDVADSIFKFLKEEGIGFMLNSKAIQVTEENNEIHLVISQNGKEKTIKGSHFLVATGRRPNTPKLNLEATGIAINKHGYIEVDDYCHTNVKGIFAVGDVNGQGAFTHTAVNDAEVVLEYLFGNKSRSIFKRNMAYALFTDPPLGRVGMSEKEAFDSGKKVLKATYPMSRINRAREMGETKGFAKLLVDAETDLILGATILGVGGDEIINMFATIMHSNIPCKEYRKVMLVHPTISELMPYVLDGIAEVKNKNELKNENSN